MTQKTSPLPGFDQHQREPVKQTYPRIYLELETCGHIVTERGNRGRAVYQVVVCPQCNEQRRILHITQDGSDDRATG